jgi:hypothetical protein
MACANVGLRTRAEDKDRNAYLTRNDGLLKSLGCGVGNAPPLRRLPHFE